MPLRQQQNLGEFLTHPHSTNNMAIRSQHQSAGQLVPISMSQPNFMVPVQHLNQPTNTALNPHFPGFYNMPGVTFQTNGTGVRSIGSNGVIIQSNGITGHPNQQMSVPVSMSYQNGGTNDGSNPGQYFTYYHGSWSVGDIHMSQFNIATGRQNHSLCIAFI